MFLTLRSVCYWLQGYSLRGRVGVTLDGSLSAGTATDVSSRMIGATGAHSVHSRRGDWAPETQAGLNSVT